MRGLPGVLVLTVAIAACGGSVSPQAAASHRASPTPYVYQPPPSATTQPRPESPAPPPAQGQPPLSTAPRTSTESRLAALNCRVPLSNGSPGSGGFVSLPGGAFTSDPASNVAIDWSGAPPGQAAGPGQTRPAAYGLSYDRGVGKWLPVGATWVAPDGQSYAYPDFLAGGVRLVKVADGSTTTMGPDFMWNVLDVEAEGVYAVRFDPQGPAASGLWLLAVGKNPAQVVTSGYWQWVTTGYAFGFDAPSVPRGAPHPLLRLNLRDHTTVTWYQQGEQIQYLAGFDRDGSPVAVFTPTYNNFGSPPWQTALIPQPNQLNTILVAPQGAQQPVVRDSHGFWMEAGGLYFNEIGVGGYQVSAVGGQLGGGCA